MFRRLLRALRPRRESASAHQPVTTPTTYGQTAAVPLTPRDREAAARDLSTLSSPFGRREAGATEKLIAAMAQNFPFVPELIAADTVDDQVAIVEQHVSIEDYFRVILLLITIEFNFKEKDRRPNEALKLATLRYRLTTMLPEKWDPNTALGLSPTRMQADALASLGSLLVESGELSGGLDYLNLAEEAYAKDEHERTRLGITWESEYDRVMSRQDVRAVLYENMATVYRQVGDEEKAQMYLARAYELDRRRPTTDVQVDRLVAAGAGAVERGDFDDGLRALHQALDLAVSDQANQITTRQVVTVCHHLGEAHARLRLYRGALRYHQRALELNRESGYLERMAHDHLSIARILAARPDLGDSLEHYEDALQCVSVPAQAGEPFTWSAADGTVFRVQEPELAWQSAQGAGVVQTERKAYPQAEQSLALAVELSEVVRGNIAEDEYRMGWHATRLDAYDAMIRLQVQRVIHRGDGDDVAENAASTAWHYVERARSRGFLDLLGESSIHPPFGVPSELMVREQELIERVRALSASTSPGDTAHRRTWDAYVAARGELEEVWRVMITATPSAEEYVALRRSQPIGVGGLHQLLVA